MGLSKLIVGLGNPGPEYALTRHNVGFAAVDLLAERLGQAFRLRGGSCAVVDGRDRRVAPFLLLKPLTYMNLSGSPLRKVLDDLGHFHGAVLVAAADRRQDLADALLPALVDPDRVERTVDVARRPAEEERREQRFEHAPGFLQAELHRPAGELH